jgi:uncharacterized protein YukE
MDGYAVEPTGLRNFRDNSLAPLAGDLSRLQQALTDAGVPLSAFPPIVADVAGTHVANHASTLQGLGVLKGFVDGDGDKVTKTALGYDTAEFDAAQAVASPSGGPVSPVTAATARTTASTTATSPVSTPVSTTQVDDAYNLVERLLSSMGLSALAQRLKKQLDAIVRPSEPFRDAAGRLDGVRSTAGDVRTAFFSDLDRLKSQWSGTAGDQHRAATTDRYQPHFEAIDAYSKGEAEKLRYNAQAQDKQNSDVIFICTWLAWIVMSVMLIRMLNPAANYAGLTIVLWAFGTAGVLLLLAIQIYQRSWKK